MKNRYRRFKEFIRRIAITLCRGLLYFFSRTYRVQNRPVLVLAPHPDDETLGCGGLIARRRNEGYEVHIVFLTDGSASHPEHPLITPTELATLRRAEALAAADALDVDPACVHFLDEPDGGLNILTPQRRQHLVQRLGDFISLTAPGRIFVPCSPDGSSEHDPVLGLAIDALNSREVRAEIWQYPVWCWWNPTLLLDKIFVFADAYYHESEDFMQHKRRALACYRSQVEPSPPWHEASLPPTMVDFCLWDPEYYFRTPSSLIRKEPPPY